MASGITVFLCFVLTVNITTGLFFPSRESLNKAAQRISGGRQVKIKKY